MGSKDQELDYEALGVDPPSHTDHGATVDDLRSRLKPVTRTNWRLVGNQLTCDTEWGELVQSIDPGYILTGTDEAGKPVFKKL